ncbi:MAG: hypothetical protein LIP03_04510 [Bacteroidales bacterium]|nr:hypothetical protein [Bacteroidales bacterium]
MELHIAIKNLAKYQGEDFLYGQTFLNALSDFNAYEQHSALKGIMRIIVQDGYARKLSQCPSWDVAAQQLVANVVKTYAMNTSSVTYAMQSLAYALGKMESEPQLCLKDPSQNGGTPQTQPSAQTPQPPQAPHVPQPPQAPHVPQVPHAPQREYQPPQSYQPQPQGQSLNWNKMTHEQKENYLSSLVCILPSSNLMVNELTVHIEDNNKYFCFVDYDVSRSYATYGAVTMYCAIYDYEGKMVGSAHLDSFTHTFTGRRRGVKAFVKCSAPHSKIGRILVYFNE